jgi:RsiW-degrading membrane proteinase PrsW (M82 family)
MALNNAYYDKLKSQIIDDRSLHFEYVKTIQNYITGVRENRSFDIQYIKQSLEVNNLKAYYQNVIHNSYEGSEQADLAHFYLSLYHSYVGEFENAFDHFDLMYDSTSSSYSYALANLYFQTYSAEDSIIEARFWNASADSIFKIDAYNNLARLAYWKGDKRLLKELVYDENIAPVLRSYYKREGYLLSLDFLNYWKVIFEKEVHQFSILGFISAFLILFVWIIFIRKMDIYEPEKWRDIILVLILSCLTIFLVYPYNDLIQNVFGYYSSNSPVGNFIHMIFTIGIGEELVKIIPVLIIIRFSKAVNEPFDFILYSSISALGFAFIENLQYIQQSSLYNIQARSLYACVAHMVFSSTAGYGLMLARYNRDIKNPKWTAIKFFLLAATMHAFYDFWLIDHWGQQFEWLTTVYFILSIHVWFIYVNNSLNITTFYDPYVTAKNDHYKFHLMFGLLGIFMFGYIANSFTQGHEFGNNFLYRGVFSYGYFILYLAFSMSRFDIVRGYINPFKFSFDILIPRLKRKINWSGASLMVYASKKHQVLEVKPDLPVSGVLERRVVLDNNEKGYLLKLDRKMSPHNLQIEEVVLIPVHENKELGALKYINSHMYLVPSEDVLIQTILKKSDFIHAGIVVTQRIQNEVDIN